jgi:Ni,Fe-hydrogenase maturation factor
MSDQLTIHIFGNPLLPFDSLPIKLVPELERRFPEFDFRITDPNENLKPVDGKLVIIDTVTGIDKAVIIDDIDKIESDTIYSAHDLDLGFNLKLLNTIGKLKKATIFGVPPGTEYQPALDQLTELITNRLVDTDT